MPSDKTRREFLITAGTGVAVGLVAGATAGRAQSASSDYGAGGDVGAREVTRKNVVSAAAAGDLESLRRGVAAMKQLATTTPDDPRGWIQQAFIHGDCFRFTDCQHGNWFFAPWHRVYLYYFEELIRKYSGNDGFALPYWDWSRTHQVPDSFYGRGNALDDDMSLQGQCPGAPTAGRGRAQGSRFTQRELDTYVGPRVVAGIQSNPDFTTYGGGEGSGTGTLEGLPHNFVHNWVGGAKASNMVRTYSPMDPIFWMHHCNVDRLYSNWLARAGHQPPNSRNWTDQSFDDFVDRDGRPAGGQYTCGQTVDSRVLGYVYDNALELPDTMAGRSERLLAPTNVGTARSGAGSAENGVLAFVTGAPVAATRRFMNAAATGVEDYVVRLKLMGVKTPEQQATGVHVFLGNGGITPETPITAPGYVGSFTFFGNPNADAAGDDGHGHEHGSKAVLLNANEALESLYGDSSLPDEPLRISLVTRPLYEGVDSHARVEEIQPDHVEIEVVDLYR